MQTKQIAVAFAGPVSATLFVWIILSPVFLTYFSVESEPISVNNMTHTSLQLDNIGLLQAKNPLVYLEFDQPIIVNDFDCLEGVMNKSNVKNIMTIEFERMSQNMPCVVILNGTNFDITATTITADNIPAINYTYSIGDALYILIWIGVGLFLPLIAAISMLSAIVFNIGLEPLGAHRSKSEFQKTIQKIYQIKCNNCDEAILWRIHKGDNTIFDLFLSTHLSERYIKYRMKRMIKRKLVAKNNSKLELHKKITHFLDNDGNQYLIDRPYHLLTKEAFSLIRKTMSECIMTRLAPKLKQHSNVVILLGITLTLFPILVLFWHGVIFKNMRI